MKNLFKVLFLVFALFIIIGCNDNKEEPKTEYKIEYFVNEVLFKIDTYFENEKTVDNKYKPEEVTGMTFVGWFNGDDKFVFGSEITENIRLDAKFDSNKYTVTFYDQNGNELKKVTVEHGNDVKEEDLPVVEGFKLTEMDKELSNITENISVTCTFKQMHLVTIYDIDGEVYLQLEMERGSKIGTIDYAIESTSKYVFSIDSWYKDKELTEQFRLNRSVTTDLALYPKVIAKPVDDTPEGKTISILGDSISTFYEAGSEINSYYGGTNQFYYPLYSSTVKKVSKTWWYLLNKKLSTRIGINNSWSGSSAYGNSNSTTMSDARINTLGENGEPDIIIIFIGTNDNVNGHTVNQFKTAYETMFKKIEKKYPNAHIFGCTLGYSAYTGYNYTEGTRVKYNEVIREVCKKYSGKVIELAEVQTKENYTQLLGDNLHLNATGMVAASEKMALVINNYYSKGVEYNYQK